jgi:methionyl-tRNA formyltransferase
LKSAPKIFKETCRIDWSKDAKDVRNFIRGLSPYPAAWTELHIENMEPITMKIFDCEIITEPNILVTGSVLHDKSNIDIAVKNGYIRLLDVQQAANECKRFSEWLSNG